MNEFITNQVVALGGSFNPPTLAHYEMIRFFVQEGAKKIILVPNGDNYQISYQSKRLVPFSHRYQMCKIMMEELNYPTYEISTIENTRKFSGTYVTLKELNHPIFAMGSDCLLELPLWTKYQDLVKENRFVVFTRKERENEMISFLQQHSFLKDYIPHFLFVPFAYADISSSSFRETKNSSILLPKVMEYIKENQLYEV